MTDGKKLKIGVLESTLRTRFRGAEELSPEIVFITGSSAGLFAGMRDGELDAAFVIGPPEEAGIRREPVFSERVLLASGGDAGGPPEEFACLPPGCAYRRAGETWMESCGVKPERIREVHSYDELFHAVASGAFAFIPESVKPLIPGGADVFRYEPLPAPYGEVWVFCVSKTSDSERILPAVSQILSKFTGGDGKKE